MSRCHSKPLARRDFRSAANLCVCVRREMNSKMLIKNSSSDARRSTHYGQSIYDKDKLAMNALSLPRCRRTVKAQMKRQRVNVCIGLRSLFDGRRFAEHVQSTLDMVVSSALNEIEPDICQPLAVMHFTLSTRPNVKIHSTVWRK